MSPTRYLCATVLDLVSELLYIEKKKYNKEYTSKAPLKAMSHVKKVNITDVNIKIRILKALATYKPFGMFKHFVMLKVLRNLKQPNAISAGDIWKFLDERYGIENLDRCINNTYDVGKFSYDGI
ncbi:Chromatin modification-related protein EAF7 [Nosema granulosis]|uniref:Chromatin modification-related protein EAF7 n=1 Tax=Nosema granulosis TaxID=83296 RepID=A0A9P6GZE5_9MICR|nr:Chromatin modification-related protein EAF7 [Nosema granulosis]